MNTLLNYTPPETTTETKISQYTEPNINTILHDKYYGAQNVYDTFNKKLSTGELVETITATINYDESKNKYYYEINHPKYNTYEYGITNFIILDNIDKIEMISLYYKGACFERAYPFIIKYNKPFTILDGTVLPLLKNINYKFDIKTFVSFNIQYDIIKFNYHDSHSISEYPCHISQYTYEKNIVNNCIDLIFCHPIIKILIYSITDISNVYLVINNTYTIYFTKNNDVWEYVFNPSVNFSKIDYAKLYFNSNKNNQIYVRAFSRNIIRTNGDIVGMALVR